MKCSIGENQFDAGENRSAAALMDDSVVASMFGKVRALGSSSCRQLERK